MRSHTICLSCLLLCLFAVAPPAAAQSWSSCSYLYCDSGGYYDSGSGYIYGYSSTSADFYWAELVVISEVKNENGSILNSNSSWSPYGYAYAAVSAIPTTDGFFYVQGTHEYGWEIDYGIDGYSATPWIEVAHLSAQYDSYWYSGQNYSITISGITLYNKWDHPLQRANHVWMQLGRLQHRLVFWQSAGHGNSFG